MKITFALPIALILMVIDLGHAGTRARRLVEQSQVTSTSLTVTVGKREVTRTIYCLESVAGHIRPRGGNEVLFTPFSTQFRNLRKRQPQSKKIRLLRLLSRKGTKACRKLPLPTQPAPAPPPSSGPIRPPSPTQTPTPPVTGNFDSQGNVTEAGRIAFGIPSGVSANITRGRAVYQSYCIGCHGEKVNRNYPTLNQAIRASPMLYDDTQISRPQQLADLVAYLNRFRAS